MRSDSFQRLSCTVPLATWQRLESALNGGAAGSRSAAVAEAIDLWVQSWELEQFRRQGGLLTLQDAPEEDYRSLRRAAGTAG